MKQAVILHTIEDVKHCLRHGIHKDRILFSANVNVAYYLKYGCGLECHELCSFVEAKEYLDIQKTTLRTCGRLLAELDHYLAPEFNRCLGLSMQYFKPLYSFLGAVQLALYTFMICCLKRMQQEYQCDVLLVYDALIGPLNRPIENHLAKTLPGIEYRIVNYKNNAPLQKTVVGNMAIDDIFQLLNHDSDYATDKTVPHRKEKVERNILVFEPVDKLKSLLLNDSAKNAQLFNPWLPLAENKCEYQLTQSFFPLANSLKSISSADGSDTATLRVFYDAIKENFCQNIAQYLQILYKYKRSFEESPLHYLYWEEPPYQGIGALLAEYFMTTDITKVIGLQSQGLFFVGQVHYLYAFEHIFSRCDRFMTNGATYEDLAALYPQSLDAVEIVPPRESPSAGEKNSRAVERQSADIALYLDWTYSIHRYGMITMNVAAQDAILSFLEAQKGKIIHVVFPGHPTHEICALLSKLNTLNNVVIIKDAIISDYLSKYAPRVVVLSSQITNLGELVFDDPEIVMINTSPQVFADKVLEVLNNRIHFAERLEDVKLLLKASLDGSLAKKSDNSYGMKFNIRWQAEQQLTKV